MKLRKSSLFLGVVVLLAATSPLLGIEFRLANSFEDAHGASCRVCVPGARGSGLFVGTKGDDAYILTNFHVVTKNKTARLDFWTNGVMESVVGRIVWRAYDLSDDPEDFAVVVVPVQELKAIDPPWVPLGGSDARPSEGAMIISSGAPDGRFPQAWKGQILEYYNGKTAIFSPPPVPGQSGSAICEYIDGQLFVTGILTWLIGEKGNDDSKGGAIPIANLYKALGKRGVNVDYHSPGVSPVPPNATECAETDVSGPCVLEFTQSDCPPCVEAQKDVEFLRALNVPVYVYDVESELGAEYVKRYKIERTPTFTLLDDGFKPIQSFIGAGKGDEIRTAYESVKQKISNNTKNAENSNSKGDDAPSESGLHFLLPTDTGKVASPPDKNNKDDGSTPPEGRVFASPLTPEPPSFSSNAPLNLPELAPILPQTADFRNRAPVFEFAGDVGFFEDSDERWQELKRRRNRDNQQNEDDQSSSEDNARQRLKDRVQGRRKLSVNRSTKRLKISKSK